MKYKLKTVDKIAFIGIIICLLGLGGMFLYSYLTQKNINNEPSIALYNTLEQVDGISDKTAEVIVNERNKKPFIDWKDLDNRCGNKIGAIKVELIKDTYILEPQKENVNLKIEEWEEYKNGKEKNKKTK